MSIVAAIPSSKSRSLVSLLSIVGGVIVAGGFLYPCLLVVIDKTCHRRYCHFGVIQSSILSGWQIITIAAHPADPPFIRFIAYPYDLTSLVPLVVGAVVLFVSIGGLLNQPPRWLLLLVLSITAIGLAFLIYDTTLLSGEITSYYPGYILITSLTPLSRAGHMLLYLGYLLIALGFVSMLRRSKNNLT